MQYKHRRHTGKEVDWNCACLCTKCGFSTTIISTKMHPFVVAVVFKFKLPECWNMREGSSGKKISFQKKRIMGLHFQMLSFIMENGKQNVCQKIGEKKQFADFSFSWIHHRLSFLPLPSQNVCRKNKNIRNSCDELCPLWLWRSEILKPPPGICWLFKANCGAWAHSSRGPCFKPVVFVRRTVTTFAHTRTGSFLSHSAEKSLILIHVHQGVPHFKWHQLIWLSNEKTKYHEQMKR